MFICYKMAKKILDGIELDELDPVARIKMERYQRMLTERAWRERSKQLENCEEQAYWENTARTALLRFPELEKGERIHAAEVKRRLSEIRNAGYTILPYSNMNAREAWLYLEQIRRDINANARIYCPDILAEITRKNEERKIEARTIR